MLDEGFEYWFTDHEQVRSPFPVSMHNILKAKTSERFSEWLSTIGEKDASQLEKSALVEMFEMFLFNVALSLCDDKDQQITISFPFLPRCGDEVNDVNHGLSEVISRELIEKEESKRQLRLFLATKSGEKAWQTEFDLPA